MLFLGIWPSRRGAAAWFDPDDLWIHIPRVKGVELVAFKFLYPLDLLEELEG